MGATTLAATKPKCFVISPIGEDGSETRVAADQVLKHIIRKGIGDDYEITRGDEEDNPGSITPQIVASILEADLVVADLSGFNPNVYYELAIAHGYNRPTVHLQDKREKPPFDLKDARLIRYDLQNPDNIDNSQDQLRRYAAFAVSNPKKLITPLSTAQLFVQVDGSDDPVAQSYLELSDQLRTLRKEVRQSGPGGATDRSADIRGMRSLIEAARNREALTAEDFRGVITSSTSDEFDEWAHTLLSRVDPTSDATILQED